MVEPRLRYQRAFSLFEVMVAMGLIFVVLGLLSTLMREFSRVSRHSAARDNSLDGLQFALSEMSNELSSAVVVTGSGSSLAFRKIDPAVIRFSDPPATAWNPRAAADLMNVVYSKEPGTGSLIRQSSGPSGTTRQVMVKTIHGFQATPLGTEFYQLSLSFHEAERLRAFSVQCRLWVAP